MKKNETPATPQTAEAAETKISANSEATVKKSVVVGLPSKLATRPGFPGVAGQPGYKAKSSKATGAKKRVRQ